MVNNKIKGLKHYLELDARLKEIVAEINYSVSAVVVEGKRDEEAIQAIGLKSPVVQFCSSGLPVFAFVEDLVERYKGCTILILLDFDQEGKEMTDRIGQELTERGVRIETTLRRELANLLLREGILRIEEIQTLRRRAAV